MNKTFSCCIYGLMYIEEFFNDSGIDFFDEIKRRLLFFKWFIYSGVVRISEVISFNQILNKIIANILTYCIRMRN